MKVTLRKIVYPEWVAKAYAKMDEEAREDIVKASIYTQIEPKGDDKFKISELLQKGANRVSILENMEHCLWALGITLTFMAWNVMEDRDEVEVADEEREMPEKQYEIMIRVDTNDADYDVSTTEITEEDLNSILPIIKAIKNFKPYKSKSKRDLDYTHSHNWPTGEMLREDLGEKKPEDIYPNLDFEHDAMYLFEDILPSGGEYGFHTIDKIEVYPKPEKEVLL